MAEIVKLKKSPLFVDLDKSSKEAERRVRRIRDSTNNKPVANEILKRKRVLSQIGGSVNSQIIVPDPPRPVKKKKITARRLKD